MLIDQFHQVWLVDFEFQQLAGEVPQPICLVAREYRSHQTIRLWCDELHNLCASPVPWGAEDLFVSYFASAEISCYLVLGWPVPARVLDLYAEFRVATNGLTTPHGRGLLGALKYYGLAAIEQVEKEEMRELAMRGGPWSAAERLALLDYCESDVKALERLLSVMLPEIDLPRALLRGRYMVAVARMERVGVPIDAVTYLRFKEHWDQLLEVIIAESDIYSLYEGSSFKLYNFASWLINNHLAWPYLDTGNLALDSDTFQLVAEREPSIRPITDLRSLISELRFPIKLSIGSDGRNRCLLSPFASRTSRNQPSNAKYIFGPSSWLRGLIQPEPGQALAYIDWSQQEFAIGGVLSGDSAMVEAYNSGDPYLTFGKQAGIIPQAGTDKSHPVERNRCKICILGTQYGMGPVALARQIGQSPAHAKELLELHRRTYPDYWRWSDGTEYTGMLGGRLHTIFGWPLHVIGGANPRSLRNFPVQGNGAEMLRLACCLATERGVRVSAPVHDAILVESDDSDIDDIVVKTQAAMAEASCIILDGFVLRSKAQILRYPDRLLDDKKTRPMWDKIVQILSTF